MELRMNLTAKGCKVLSNKHWMAVAQELISLVSVSGGKMASLDSEDQGFRVDINEFSKEEPEEKPRWISEPEEFSEMMNDCSQVSSF